MKTKTKPVHNLHLLLTYLLEGMYDAEKQIQKDIPEWVRKTTSPTLKNQIRKYGETTRDKRTKLKRIFSYLLAGPFKRKSTVVAELRKDWSRLAAMTESRQLSDVAFIVFMQSMIRYKRSEYISARDMALQLNLTTVVDLLEEIMDWEQEAKTALTRIALTDVNQKVRELVM